VLLRTWPCMDAGSEENGVEALRSQDRASHHGSLRGRRRRPRSGAHRVTDVGVGFAVIGYCRLNSGGDKGLSLGRASRAARRARPSALWRQQRQQRQRHRPRPAAGGARARPAHGRFVDAEQRGGPGPLRRRTRSTLSAMTARSSRPSAPVRRRSCSDAPSAGASCRRRSRGLASSSPRNRRTGAQSRPLSRMDVRRLTGGGRGLSQSDGGNICQNCKPPAAAGLQPQSPIRGGACRRFSTGGGHGANPGPIPPAAEESHG